MVSRVGVLWSGLILAGFKDAGIRPEVGGVDEGGEDWQKSLEMTWRSEQGIGSRGTWCCG